VELLKLSIKDFISCASLYYIVQLSWWNRSSVSIQSNPSLFLKNESSKWPTNTTAMFLCFCVLRVSLCEAVWWNFQRLLVTRADSKATSWSGGWSRASGEKNASQKLSTTRVVMHRIDKYQIITVSVLYWSMPISAFYVQFILTLLLAAVRQKADIEFRS